jgi:hypothetical protein
MADWYASFPAVSGANNISIHLVVNEGTRTSSSVTVNFALYIERTVGTGFWAGVNNGNQATVTIDGQTYTYSNYTYDFRTGSGTFRQFTIGSGSKTISTSSPKTITVSAQAVEAANPPGTATISGQSFTVTPSPAFTDSTIVSTANVGAAYSDAVAASGSPTYAVRNVADDATGVLPTGLTLNTSTGAITGTPTAPGVFNFRIRATNAGGSATTGTLTITVLGGGRVWNGTAFVAGTTRVWNGTAFVSSTTKVWNGSSWESAK